MPMAVYAIALLKIDDRSEYANYEKGFMEIFARYSGKLLAVDEAPLVLEGEWPHTRTVLIEFPNQAELDRWYRSDAYQRLAQHRFKASTGAIAVIQGLATPAP
jgi:uncharacterized protein (DUF1330 family)